MEVTGTFEREVNGDASLPSSTALFVYLEPYDGPFICGVGTINSSTGGFTATVTGVPDGFSKIFYSFVVLDLEDAVEIDTDSAESVFDADVISFRCPSPLTITLEWNTDTSDFDMEITEPDGSVWFAWDIGVSPQLVQDEIWWSVEPRESVGSIVRDNVHREIVERFMLLLMNSSTR